MDKAIEFDPDNSKFYHNKADVVFAWVKWCDKLIGLDPNDSKVYNIKGTSLNSLKRHEIQCYDKTIRIDSDEAIFYHSKANAFFVLKNIKKQLNGMIKQLN